MACNPFMPATCPDLGRWTFGLGFGYRDGFSEDLESFSPCRSGTPPPPPPTSHGQPRIRIHGVPRDCVSRRFVARIQITDRLPLGLKDWILDRAGHQLAAVALKPRG